MASNRFDPRGSRTRSGGRLNLRSHYGDNVRFERYTKKKGNRALNKAQLRINSIYFEPKALRWDFS